MTDITGNFGVNSRNYNNIQEKQQDTSSNVYSSKENSVLDNKEVDLGKQPAAITGKTLVNHVSSKKGDYTFDEKNVEADTLEFMYLTDLAKSLIKAGYDKDTAIDYVATLASNSNYDK